jgi:hypothetical protein
MLIVEGVREVSSFLKMSVFLAEPCWWAYSCYLLKLEISYWAVLSFCLRVLSLLSNAAFFPENSLFLPLDPESSLKDVGCFCGDLGMI